MLHVYNRHVCVQWGHDMWTRFHMVNTTSIDMLRFISMSSNEQGEVVIYVLLHRYTTNLNMTMAMFQVQYILWFRYVYSEILRTMLHSSMNHENHVSYSTLDSPIFSHNSRMKKKTHYICNKYVHDPPAIYLHAFPCNTFKVSDISNKHIWTTLNMIGEHSTWPSKHLGMCNIHGLVVQRT